MEGFASDESEGPEVGTLEFVRVKKGTHKRYPYEI